MSEKELNYVEDIYNHEKLIIEVITNELKNIKDEKYLNMFECHLKSHDDMIKKLKKYMEGLA